MTQAPPVTWRPPFRAIRSSNGDVIGRAWACPLPSTAWRSHLFSSGWGRFTKEKNQTGWQPGLFLHIRSKRPCATYWQCTVRPKGNQCKATVIKRDGVFTAGQAVHNHPQAVGTYTAVKIISTVKRKAVADVFKPASAIVDGVMTQCTTVITQFTDFFQASLGNCI